MLKENDIKRKKGNIKLYYVSCTRIVGSFIRREYNVIPPNLEALFSAKQSVQGNYKHGVQGNYKQGVQEN